MSLRITFAVVAVFALSLLAWRGKWHVAACALVVMMAFLERRDMPRTIFGIPGLNLWNCLCLNVTCAWLCWRAREGLRWSVPAGLRWPGLLYLFVVTSAFVRSFIDPTPYSESGRLGLLLDYLVNPLKFLLPGIILYDGTHCRQQTTTALAAIMLTYFLLAVMVIRSMGIDLNFSGDDLNNRAARVLARDTGYNRVDLSMMLAGASWAMFAFSRLRSAWWQKQLLWGAAGMILFAQTLTGGRTGYVTWAAVGLVLCLVRWRRLLLLLPVLMTLLVILVPGVSERLLHGFDSRHGSILRREDNTEITSGRSVIWPYVIRTISDSPWFGYGRAAMQRTGLEAWLATELNEPGFGHPHNAYLEILLDNGIVGLFCVLPLYAVMLRRALGLFGDSGDPIYTAVGGVTSALLLALLIASLGAQTLYPREGVVGMWAAIGLTLRAWEYRNGRPLHEESTPSLTEPCAGPFPA